MGSKISIDKHTSNIEDILEMNDVYFNKIKFENKIPDSITQHIKVLIYQISWQFYFFNHNFLFHFSQSF